MAQNRKQRRISGRDVHVTRGHFPLSGGRFVRVEFPAKLTTQGKYDVATALAKAAAKLVAEADAANAAPPMCRLENGEWVHQPRCSQYEAPRVPYDPAARHARAVQTEVELGLRPAEAACKHDDPLVIDGQTAWCPPCGALYGMKAWRLPEGRSRPEVRPGCITCATEPALPGKLHCAGHEAGRLSPGDAQFSSAAPEPAPVVIEAFALLDRLSGEVAEAMQGRDWDRCGAVVDGVDQFLVDHGFHPEDARLRRERAKTSGNNPGAVIDSPPGVIHHAPVRGPEEAGTFCSRCKAVQDGWISSCIDHGVAAPNASHTKGEHG